jgi:hypothetical protein
MKKSIAPKIEAVVVDKLGSIYPNVNYGAVRAVEGFPVLRQYTLQEIKGRWQAGELKLLFDVLNGTIFSASTSKPDFLAIEVQDGCELDGLDKKWKVDQKALIDKIMGLTFAQCFFLIDWVNVFWQKNNKKKLNLDDYLSELL